MTKKGFNSVSLVVTFLFVVAFSFFGYRVFNDKKNGRRNAEEKFQLLAENTKAASNFYASDPYLFSQKFIEGAGNFSDYNSLNLKIDGTLFYSYPPSSSKKHSGAAEDFYATFTTQNGNVILLEASVFRIQPGSLYQYGKISFIIIFIGTVISLLFLIFAKVEEMNGEKESLYVLVEGKNESSAFKEDEKNGGEEYYFDFHSEQPSAAEEEDDGDDAIAFEDVSGKEEMQPDEISESPEENDISQEIKKDETPFQEENPAADVEDSSGGKQTIEAEITGVKKSEQTATDAVIEEIKLKNQNEFRLKLEEEIARSAQNDSDLTVLIFNIKGIEKGSFLAKKIEDAVRNIIEDKELFFDFGGERYSLILRCTELDAALDLSDRLYEEITKSFSKVKPSAVLTMGLSAQAGRLIRGESLITEATEAQRRAASDSSSPIIAFRVNPEKYKDYILNS